MSSKDASFLSLCFKPPGCVSALTDHIFPSLFGDFDSFILLKQIN